MEAEAPQAEAPAEAPLAPAAEAQAGPPRPVGPPSQPARAASPAAVEGARGGPHWEGKDLWGMYPPLAVLEGEEVGATSQQRQAKPRKPRGQKKKAAAKTGVAADGTMQAAVPAEKAELVSAAKAMHRDQFGKHVEELFHLEKEAALKALRTGLYVGWRCPEYLWDCFRVGDHSKCFCGHLLNEHQAYKGTQGAVPCAVERCECQSFTFVPSRPEDVGEFRLRRRVPLGHFAWCRCKHSHEKHAPSAGRPCRIAGCFCKSFESTFSCAACDRRWEEHQTFFETTEARKRGGLPYGEKYLVFAEIPEMRNAVLTGKPSDDSAYQALLAELPSPSGSRAPPLPPPEPQSPPE